VQSGKAGLVKKAPIGELLTLEELAFELLFHPNNAVLFAVALDLLDVGVLAGISRTRNAKSP